MLFYHIHGPAIRKKKIYIYIINIFINIYINIYIIFSCSHIHIERINCSKGILQSVKDTAVFHAELIPIIQTEDYPLLKHCSWDLRTPEPRREWLISPQISIEYKVVNAASRAVCKGALAANCPSAIRHLNYFLCSCSDLINKICKLIIIKKMITCQKDLII